MARLEAARRIASGMPPRAASRYGAAAKSDDVERVADSASIDDPLHTPDLEGKPAHLLVAQLEQEESTWARNEAARVEEVFAAAAPIEEIAKVEVSVEAPKKGPPTPSVGRARAARCGGVGGAQLRLQQRSG